MKRKILIVLAIFLAILAVPWGVLKFVRGSARKSWKDQAIVRVEAAVKDSTRFEAELARLKAAASTNDSSSDNWLSSRLILMRNGEWICYASACQKENRRIQDIFLGRGSDGKWYFSTFHFCIGMASLRVDQQAESLKQFAQEYCLREFDGRSDECLKKTWP